jgi:tetratricopeptide (TPR) repeat protein
MKVSRLVLGAAAVALVAAGVWWWRAATTPDLPEIPLDGAAKPMVEAVEAARAEVRQNPRSGAAWGKLGLVLGANHYPQPAVACFTHAERFDPDNPLWPYMHAHHLLQLGDAEPAPPSFQRALDRARPRDERTTLLSRMALLALREGSLDQAARYIDAHRDLDPEDPRLHYAQALLAIARDDRAAARAHLNRLTDSPLARKQAHTLLATLADGDRELARTHQEQANRLPPDASWPDPFLSELARHEVARRAPIDEYWDLERDGRSAEALFYLRRLAAEAPDEEVCFTLGFALYKANAFDEAVPALRTALGFNPRNPKAHLFLGAALLNQGEREHRKPGGAPKAAPLFREAVEAEDRALALQSNLGFAHLIRGRALKYLDRPAEAVDALRQAVLCQPESAEMHTALGETLAETGQVAEGVKRLEDAVRVAAPNDPRPREALEKWRAKLKK